jgi:hypothetical protein
MHYTTLDGARGRFKNIIFKLIFVMPSSNYEVILTFYLILYVLHFLHNSFLTKKSVFFFKLNTKVKLCLLLDYFISFLYGFIQYNK